jgi:hypothetical protein
MAAAAFKGFKWSGVRHLDHISKDRTILRNIHQNLTYWPPTTDALNDIASIGFHFGSSH